MRLIEFTGQLVEQEDLRYRDDNQLLTFSTPIGNITILVNLDQYTNNFLTAGSALKIGSQWHVSVRQILVPELGVMLLELWRATQVNYVPTADKVDSKAESTPEQSTTANDSNTNNFKQAKAALRQSAPVQNREPVSQSHGDEVSDENIDPLAVDLNDYNPSLTDKVNDDPADYEEDTLGDFAQRSFGNSAFDFSTTTTTQDKNSAAQAPAKEELDLGNKSQMLATDDDQVVDDDEFEDTDDDLL